MITCAGSFVGTLRSQALANEPAHVIILLSRASCCSNLTTCVGTAILEEKTILGRAPLVRHGVLCSHTIAVVNVEMLVEHEQTIPWLAHLESEL